MVGQVLLHRWKITGLVRARVNVITKAIMIFITIGTEVHKLVSNATRCNVGHHDRELFVSEWAIQFTIQNKGSKRLATKIVHDVMPERLWSKGLRPILSPS